MGARRPHANDGRHLFADPVVVGGSQPADGHHQVDLPLTRVGDEGCELIHAAPHGRQPAQGVAPFLEVQADLPEEVSDVLGLGTVHVLKELVADEQDLSAHAGLKGEKRKKGGGVKHFDRAAYARVKPILAERMAQYIVAHRDSYDRMATFTEGRYAEVMQEAKKRTALDFPVLPRLEGPRIVRMGRSIPLRYWEKYWIQLYLEIVSWLGPVMQARAEVRLRTMDVEYR